MTMMKKMMMRMMFACSLLLSSGWSLSSCPWMEHKFRQYSEETVELLDKMVQNRTNASSTEMDMAFPYHMYQLASKAPADEKLAFSVQVLNEVSDLFKEDHKATSWDEKNVDNFLNVVNRQAEELKTCIKSKVHTRKHKKLQLYFKRLSHNVLEQKNLSAAAWEITRKEVKLHLLNVDRVASALIPTN